MLKSYITVGTYCKSTSIVVVWFLVGLLLKLAELKSRGWCIYRGNAAEIAIESNVRVKSNV